MGGNAMFQRIFGVPVLVTRLAPKDRVIITTEEIMEQEQRIKDLKESGVMPASEMKDGGVKAAKQGVSEVYTVRIEWIDGARYLNTALGLTPENLLDEASLFRTPSAAMRGYAKFVRRHDPRSGKHLDKLVRVREVMERTVEVVK